MDDEAELRFFDMAFVSILSFQFHPANHSLGLEGPTHDNVKAALDTAWAATRARREFLYGEH